MKEAREVLGDIESLSQQSSDQAAYVFLIAVELKHLELSRDSIQMLKRAVNLSSEIHDDRAVANTALWLARWGAEDEAETAINGLSMPSIRENAMKCLNEIQTFKEATTD